MWYSLLDVMFDIWCDVHCSMFDVMLKVWCRDCHDHCLMFNAWRYVQPSMPSTFFRQPSFFCYLNLNPSSFGTHQRLWTFPATPSIHIYDTMVELSDQITSLGVVMDSNLTFNAHITALCNTCHFHLRSLRHIRCSLADDIAILIAVALVQSRLDYCNSFFFNMSCFNINKLQHVQNLAVRLALNDWHSPT